MKIIVLDKEGNVMALHGFQKDKHLCVPEIRITENKDQIFIELKDYVLKDKRVVKYVNDDWDMSAIKSDNN